MNFTRLKKFLDFELPTLGIPGSDTVIYVNREEVFRHTSGYDSLSERTRLKQNALYNMYSCTKVTTAVAATQLIERGEITVTDPIYAYFPEFENMLVKVKDESGNVIDLRPAKSPITIQQLLTMTSGINYNLQNPSIAEFKAKTDGRCPTVLFPSAIAKEPLEFDPGTRWCYGLSLDVIGALIELVSGKKLGEYMKENIFEPLGMKNTSFGFTDEKLERMAIQYRFDPQTCSAVEIPKNQNQFVLGPEFESGGAGLISCLDDQILLTDALTHLGLGKNGNRILSERAVNLMRSDALNDSTRKTFTPSHFKGYSYGYGVRVNHNPSSVGNLAPMGEFGWDGAKMSYISCDPENKVSMFHAEHMGGVASIVWPKLRNLLYSSLDY